MVEMVGELRPRQGWDGKEWSECVGQGGENWGRVGMRTSGMRSDGEGSAGRRASNAEKRSEVEMPPSIRPTISQCIAFRC